MGTCVTGSKYGPAFCILICTQSQLWPEHPGTLTPRRPFCSPSNIAPTPGNKRQRLYPRNNPDLSIMRAAFHAGREMSAERQRTARASCPLAEGSGISLGTVSWNVTPAEHLGDTRMHAQAHSPCLHKVARAITEKPEASFFMSPQGRGWRVLTSG